MRVLFTTYPEKTHFMAMAPLAWALRTAGHEVRIASQPKFTGQITQAGLTAVPLGSDRDLWQLMSRFPEWIDGGEGGVAQPYDAALRKPHEVSWNELRKGYRFQVDRWHKMSNVPLIPQLVEFARYWQPDLVLWEPLTYAGAIAAKACGAAHGRLMYSLDLFGVTRDHFRRLRAERPAERRDDPMADWLSGYARRYGFPFAEDMITGQFSVDQFPASLRLEADLRYVPMRYIPFGGPAVVPKWLWEAPQRPRIALTLGLCNTEHSVGYTVDVQEIFNAVAGMNVELVATIAASEQGKIEFVPDNVRMIDYVPLEALVPTCSAVIHHGGFGTLCTTALNGVPQLVLPWDFDEPALASGLVGQGAALSVHATEVSAHTIRAALLRLLHDETYAIGAARLREQMAAMPTPNDVAEQLETLTGELRG